ncbi:MAG: RNA polymerase sigma factor [Segetibacter sp.]
MTAELSDENIMLKVKEGSLSELTVLFERYNVRLFNFFLKLTFDKAASEDLTQTLFYRVIKYRQTYKAEEGSFKTWIYQMGRNVYYDFYKERQKIAANFRDIHESHETIPDSNEADKEEELEKLNKALSRLIPDQREIIILSRYQGLKYREIALIKDVSITAIKVQIHRALKQLKSFYFNQP